MAPTVYDLSREQLAELLAGEPGYRSAQVWRALWERGTWPEDMSELPKSLRHRLGRMLSPALHEVSRSTSADGSTTKWLWELPDGARVETVLMLYPRRATVCVSSQAGCAMGCSFCATGQGGFTRQLSSGEIVEQVVAARRAALPRRLDNVVFMGMGEPLANYGRAWGAVERIHSHLGISARRITLSTVGVVPGIKRLAGEVLPVNLAVSLHAARDELRDQLVPLNRRYPLSALMDACAGYVETKRRRLSFEWALIAGVNDTARDAAELAGLALALPLAAHVNLIPLNPTPLYPEKGTPPEGVAAFEESLLSRGVNVTVRDNRGTDIAAACGQLAGAARERLAGAPTLGSRAAPGSGAGTRLGAPAPGSGAGTRPIALGA